MRGAALFAAGMILLPVFAAASEPLAPAKAGPGANADVDPKRFGQPLPDEAFGAFQRGYYKTAYDLALPRADAGDAAAQTLVAEILSRGLGIRQDEKAAAGWYAKAAAQGVAEAEFQYALLLLDGGLVPKDPERGMALMKQAADGGSRLAQFNIAQSILDKDRGDAGMTRAAVYYEMAAKAGLADAQYALSQLYAGGEGGKTRDDAEARRWLELAAKQAYDTAELDLAAWFIDGRGGPKDEKAGFLWMKRAAAAGNVAAQNRLAKLYVNGIGTDGDQVEGAAWYILAHRAGLNDPDMDDVLNGLTDEEQKRAIERANKLR